ncbi:hypothetical protein C0Q70_10718 [Pomacea canaliculata]|uniref:G-protein coupled receptors family 1 profile domain-containing protein n=1 Tax=Pomacea canaliculata TaxID=400727 RepID=A0A2T7P3Y7_POMCA|nr:hypothetical protein C0Q70_10718 [Pomacea canaliculata]
MEKAMWTAMALSLCLGNATAPACAMDSNRSDVALSLDVTPIGLWSVSQHWRIVTMTLSSVGVLLNVMALIIIVVHRQVTSSYRAMLFSLTAIDFGLILTTFLLAVTSIYEDTIVQTGGTKTSQIISGANFSMTITQPNPSVKTACLILTAMFHSFLISAATTTLATSVDRAVAVHSPVLYRVLSTSKIFTQLNGK